MSFIFLISSVLCLNLVVGCEKAKEHNDPQRNYVRTDKNVLTVCDGSAEGRKWVPKSERYLKYDKDLECYALNLDIGNSKVISFSSSVGGATLQLRLNPKNVRDEKYLSINYLTTGVDAFYDYPCKEHSQQLLPLSHIVADRFGQDVAQEYHALIPIEERSYLRCLNTRHRDWLSEDRKIFIKCDGDGEVCFFYVGIDKSVVLEFNGYEKSILFIAENIEFIVNQASNLIIR